MFGLPAISEFNKKIPKEKFYTVGSISSKDKEMFVSDVERIVWKNKLSEQTVNVAKGEKLGEIEVICIQLRTKDFNVKLLNIIQKMIPYAILFVLEYDGKVKLAVYHNTMLFQTEWEPEESVSIELKGLNFDAVWENIIVQVGNIKIEQGNTLDEQIALDEQRTKLKKEIARLEKLARSEKQPKKKFELVQKINEIKKE